MMTIEEYMGEEHTAFWLHGNVNDNSIDVLQDMGYEVSKQDIIVSGFINGMPRFSLDVNEAGDFMIGFEDSDIANGVMEFSPMPIDIATSQNLFLPPRYFFVKEGTPYTSVTLNKESMVEGDNIISTIGVNNLGAGSVFKFGLQYTRCFEVMDIRINEELQKIIDENNYNVILEKSIDGVFNRILQLNLYVTDKEGNKVNLSDDIKLLDVEFKLVDDSESEFYLDKYTWIEDNNGNKYELEYYANNDEYVAFNLPVSTEEYKVVSNYPGHFRKEARFVPSRVLNGEVIGKVYYLLGSEFYMYALAGDVNGDDVIDIYDAVEVAKYYGQKVDYKEVPVDFNFDGIVNADDMDFIVYNYLVANEQNSSAVEGEQYYNGKTIEDILTECGYYDEVRLDELTISDTYITLELNDTENNTAQLIATMNPENVPNIGLEWKVRNEEVATVDQNGLVTAVNPGTTIVEVAATDGSVRLYCFVTVTKDGVVPAIEEVTANTPNLEVIVGDEFELGFSINPNEVVVKSISYISSADSIVSIVDGKAVAKSSGKAIVTASINDGEAFVTWEITVKDKGNANVPGGEGRPDDGNKPGNNKPSDNNKPGEDNDGGTNNKPFDEEKDNNGQTSKKSGISVDTGKVNGKLPSTGGRSTLSVVTAALSMIGTGIIIRKNKKNK